MVDQELQVVKHIVQPDSQGRVSLGNRAKSKSYQMSINERGQILLDPLEGVLTLEEAATLLNVSKSYLNKLLRSGEIPSQEVEDGRIIRKEDVLCYKSARRAESERILAELAAQAQELGMGY